MVEATLEYGTAEGRDGMRWDTSFPFDFALTADHQREIVEVDNLAVRYIEFQRVEAALSRRYRLIGLPLTSPPRNLL